MVQEKADSLEIVYYPSPVPLNAASLTVLGLFFDRVDLSRTIPGNLGKPQRRPRIPRCVSDHPRSSGKCAVQSPTSLRSRLLQAPGTNELCELSALTGASIPTPTDAAVGFLSRWAPDPQQSTTSYSEQFYTQLVCGAIPSRRALGECRGRLGPAFLVLCRRVSGDYAALQEDCHTC